MTDAPERVWLDYDAKMGGNSFPSFEDPKSCMAPAIEYLRADIAEALVRKARNDALEEAAKVMGEYHLNRYKSREDGGELNSPAVFTSHTHQDVMELIRAMKETDQ